MANKMMIDDLNLYYGQFHALKDISLNIQEKEITAFIGPSGCGKSTLLKSLNRMNDLVEGCKITGQVTLDGTDIYRDLDVNLLRKRVGMVFQKPNPFPMSIYDNVAYGPRTHGIRSKAKLDQIVDELKKDYTIVMVTHNMQQATRISDKTVFFLLGEIIEAGKTDELFSMPKDKRTEDYITGRFG